MNHTTGLGVAVSISIPQRMEVRNGESVRIEPKLLDAGGDPVRPSGEFTYHVHPRVAAIDRDGLVVPLREGTGELEVSYWRTPTDKLYAEAILIVTR